jgi:hypothetical protein
MKYARNMGHIHHTFCGIKEGGVVRAHYRNKDKFSQVVEVGKPDKAQGSGEKNIYTIMVICFYHLMLQPPIDLIVVAYLFRDSGQMS